MDVNDIQHSLTLQEVETVLRSLGGDPIIENDMIMSKTICHGGDSHKLYYYDNAKRFTCYTGDCGYGFSIFDLVQKAIGVDFLGSKDYIVNLLNIDSSGSYVYHDNRLDMKMFDKFNELIKVDKEEPKPIKYYSEEILENFNHMYHIDWINDNIAAASMFKFGIRFNILNNQIVIPHRDITGQLIGIRVRNMSKEIVENGMKYMPLFYASWDCRHNTGDTLYGIYENKKNINKAHKIILFESEKSVMQLDGYWGSESNIGVALSGHNLSDKQIEIIHSLDIEEVIIALDKEYNNEESEIEYAKHIKEKIVDKLNPFYTVSIIWGDEQIEYKDSPTDKGADVWNDLYKNRIIGGQ